MKSIAYIMAVASFGLSSVALAQTDSTGSSSKGIANYGDITASSTWNRVSGKPATATRWPTWNEVTNKPATFPPAPHHHDSRYVMKDGDQVTTTDVGGDRWCRATSSGRIQCTHDAPGGRDCAEKTAKMFKNTIITHPKAQHLEMHARGNSLYQCKNGKWTRVFTGYTPPQEERGGGGATGQH